MNEHEANTLLERLGSQIDVQGIDARDITGSGRRHLLVRRGAQLVAVAALATLIPVGGLALLPDGTHHDSQATVGPPTISMHSGPPVTSGLSQPTEHRLWHFAAAMAHVNGGTLKVAYAVKSDRHHAELVDGGDLVPGHQPVWLILVEGNRRFVCGDCSGPAQAAPIRGWFLTSTVDAHTFQGLDFGIEDSAPDLSKLGTVFRLHP